MSLQEAEAPVRPPMASSRQLATGIRTLTNRVGGRAAQAGKGVKEVYWPWLGRLEGDTSLSPL